MATLWWTPGALVLLGVACSCLIKVPKAGLLAGSLFCALLANSVFALPKGRLNYVFDWLRLGFLVFAWQQSLLWLFFQLRNKFANFSSADRILMPWMISLPKGYERSLIQGANRARLLGKAGAFLLLVVITISVGWLVAKNIHTGDVAPLERLSVAKKRDILHEMMRRTPGLFPESDVAEALDEKRVRIARVEGRLIVDVAQLPRYSYLIYGEEGAPYPMFQNRPYERTVLQIRSAIYGMRYLTLPGKVSDSLLGAQAVVVARLHQVEHQTCLEAIALVPIEPTNNHLLWDRQIIPREAHHQALLNKIAVE
jgi:hypothetical protein